MDTKYNVTVTQLPESEVELKGEISWEVFSQYEKKAFERLSAHVEVSGFRKGHVPEAIARQQIGDELLLTDMAELTMQELYPEIVTEQKLDLVGRPELSITKLARGNALGFTIRAAVLPKIELPDYRALAKKAAPLENKEVTEEEVDKVVLDLQQMRAYGHVHTPEDAEHAHEEPLPEVTDEFAKSFGSFQSVAEMRDKIKENVAREHAQDAHDKRRIEIMETIIADTSFEIPAIVLQSEQEKMLSQIEADVARAGFTIDAYLQQASKTKEGLLEEFKPEAEKRARFQLVLNAIARDAGIAPSNEEVESEANRLMQTYPGADKARTMAYADMLLTNEKTLSMLEGE